MASRRMLDSRSGLWSSPLAHIVPRPLPPKGVLSAPPQSSLEHTPSVSHTPPEVRDSPGKGQGLFATDTIPAYTQILVDEALISLGPREHHFELLDKYKLLPKEHQAAFDALSVSTREQSSISKYETYFLNRGYSSKDAREAALVIARFMSNGFKTGNPYRWVHVVFANISRINHSCAPNALSHYRPNTGTQHIVALRDIQPGDEIEICYCQMIISRGERQQRLQQWGFTCTCRACSNALDESYEERIQSINECIDRHSTSLETYDSEIRQRLAEFTQRCIDIATLDSYPWLRATLPKLYDGLAGIMPLSADQYRIRSAMVDAKRAAYEWFVKLNGMDQPEASARYLEMQRLEHLHHE